ncbi:pyridoxamine 5'-phosphate oxidase family protein [Pseudoxanthobacter sp.]|uniref:pyridoxamine 5'-phosphate oxidase family protein n=1 Tax=Pseudoxanthobacter sp. TaxID=1925742 RepID=UPI002FE2AB01
MQDAAATAETYAVSARNRVKRLHGRGHYERAAVHAVLDAGLMCHVAYVIDGQPYCTPTMHWRVGDRLFWHGSSASRMLRHQKAGVPVCLTVSLLDGLVMARSGFNHSLNYRAAMCFGTARLVDDPAAKAEAIRGVVERFYPGRDAHLRPLSAQELKATAVMTMLIDEASAKVRATGVGDDEADYGQPVWAGVVPVHTVVGEPEPCPRVLPGTLPAAGLGPYRPGRPFDEALREAQRLYEGAAD